MLTAKQIQMIRAGFPFPKPRSRTFKQASRDEARATHVVHVVMPGCGSGADMDIFCAVGQYSDESGCDLATGDREHTFYVSGEEKVNKILENVVIAAKWLDEFNGKSLGITVRAVKK